MEVLRMTEMVVGVSQAIIGALVFILLGVLIKQVSSGLKTVSENVAAVKHSVDQLNGRLYNHVTHADSHEAGIARVSEQVKGAESVAKSAHKRIDTIEGAPR